MSKPGPKEAALRATRELQARQCRQCGGGLAKDDPDYGPCFSCRSTPARPPVGASAAAPSRILLRKPAELTPHPLTAELLPPLSDDEYAALKADIAANGILIALAVTDSGLILDGTHRWKIASELGLEVPVTRLIGLSEDAQIERILGLNIHRRQLTSDQKRDAAVKLRQRGWTQQKIATHIGVHQTTVGEWLAGDVKEILNVATATAAEASKPDLPKTVTDTKGREQPATKKRRGRKPKAAKPAAPSTEPEPEEVDLVAELEAAHATILSQQELIDSLQVSDIAKEMATWHEKYAKLDGRLRQEITTRTEAEKQARYQGKILAELRKLLKVDTSSAIVEAVKDLLK